jgi:hypothetical protein
MESSASSEKSDFVLTKPRASLNSETQVVNGSAGIEPSERE